MHQHERLARELVEAINEGDGPVLTLNDKLDVELTEMYKQRAEHAATIARANLLWNAPGLLVDAEPVVKPVADGVWLSAMVFVKTAHTGHTDFGALE